MEESVGSGMIKLTDQNWATWKPRMEGILYCKDLHESIEGDEAKPKEMTEKQWYILNRKAIGTIILWVDDSVFCHVAQETNAHKLWTKLELMFEKKAVSKKYFLIKDLVNMKYREDMSMTEHLNNFHNIINQIVNMGTVLEDELQALLLLCSLPDCWETFVVNVSNSAPNGVLSVDFVKDSMQNKETRKQFAVVHFRTLERPEEDEFCLELAENHTYVDVVERVAQHLGLDDITKIQLIPHDCRSQKPKPNPIKYGSVDCLLDMLVNYNQISDILYYEVMDNPLPELKCLKTLGVSFRHATKDEAVVLNIRLPKQSTVGDIFNEIKTKVKLSHPNAELRLLEIFYHKIHRIFPLSEKIESIYNQCWTLRAEEMRLKKEQEEKEDKRRYKVQAHLFTIIKVARDEDFKEQIGKDICFDLVDHDKVRSFSIQKQMPFILFKEEVAREFGIPVQFQRFWIWAKRQNHTYRPHRPLTPHEEAQIVGAVREVSNKAHNAELKLFLEVNHGQDLHPVPPPEKKKKDILLFFKLYDPEKEELRYVGRFFVKSYSKPMKILIKLKELAGFAPDEEIELFEEIKFEPTVMCERLDQRVSFRFSEIEDGDIICFQKKPLPEGEEKFRYPDVPSFLDYVKNHQIFPLREKIESINDQYWTLRAEEIPEEEKNLGPNSRLIHVYHFMKEFAQNQVQVWNFGEPFFLVNHDGETLADVKVRIQKKLQVPDEEFSKWKFAFLSLGRPEYLEDSDIVSSRFQRRDVYGAWEQYLGLEHADTTPKIACAANQKCRKIEKPVKIY